MTDPGPKREENSCGFQQQKSLILSCQGMLVFKIYVYLLVKPKRTQVTKFCFLGPPPPKKKKYTYEEAKFNNKKIFNTSGPSVKWF